MLPLTAAPANGLKYCFIFLCALSLAFLSGHRTAGASTGSDAAQTTGASPAPQVDPTVEAEAKSMLRGFQSGEIDSSQLNKQVRSELTPAVAQKIGAGIKPFGDPLGFAYVGSQSASAATIYDFLITFKSGKVDEFLALDADGKIAGIYFKPRLTFDDVSGREVESVIAEKLVPFVRSQGQDLTVGATTCPDHMDLTKEPGRCTMTVDDVPLAIHVILDTDAQQWVANFDGALFTRADVESYVEDDLRAMYGVSGAAHCAGTVVAVLQPGSIIHCDVAHTPRPLSITLRTQSKGKDGLYLYPVPGLTSLLPFIDSAISAHKSGAEVLLTGAQLDSYVDRWVTTEGMRPQTQVTIGKAHCPASADLTAAQSVICTVPFDGQDVRYKIWIDDEQGVQILVLDAVISKPLLEQYLERTIIEKVRASGSEAAVSVDCGSHNSIVTPAPGDYYCNVRVDGENGKAHVIVENENGTMHLEGVQMADQK